MVIKARRQGNSIVLTIPKNISVPVNTEFTVVQEKSGEIVYKPVHKKKYDLWSDTAYSNYDYSSELKQEYEDLGYNPREIKPIGRELGNND